jgi:chromosome partitioning protein
MKKMAILSQKGGAGKTTMAVNLAVAADRHGLAAAVIDIEPSDISGSMGGQSAFRSTEPEGKAGARGPSPLFAHIQNRIKGKR